MGRHEAVPLETVVKIVALRASGLGYEVLSERFGLKRTSLKRIVAKHKDKANENA